MISVVPKAGKFRFRLLQEAGVNVCIYANQLPGPRSSCSCHIMQPGGLNSVASPQAPSIIQRHEASQQLTLHLPVTPSALRLTSCRS